MHQPDLHLVTCDMHDTQFTPVDLGYACQPDLRIATCDVHDTQVYVMSLMINTVVLLPAQNSTC